MISPWSEDARPNDQLLALGTLSSHESNSVQFQSRKITAVSDIIVRSSAEAITAGFKCTAEGAKASVWKNSTGELDVIEFPVKRDDSFSLTETEFAIELAIRYACATYLAKQDIFVNYADQLTVWCSDSEKVANDYHPIAHRRLLLRLQEIFKVGDGHGSMARWIVYLSLTRDIYLGGGSSESILPRIHHCLQRLDSRDDEPQIFAPPITIYVHVKPQVFYVVRPTTPRRAKLLTLSQYE
jgi:hypothetical protein